jgi:hypothetical protein
VEAPIVLGSGIASRAAGLPLTHLDGALPGTLFAAVLALVGVQRFRGVRVEKRPLVVRVLGVLAAWGTQAVAQLDSGTQLLALCRVLTT